MRMKPDIEVVDHVSSIEQLAYQLNDSGEPILDQAMICKILSTLPHRFHYLLWTWDNVPRSEKTVEALTLRLLKEETRNKIQEGINEDEEKAFFMSRGQGQASNQTQRPLSAEEKKRRSARIAELKQKTKCRKCGKRGHWERECPDINKRISFKKTKKNGIKKCKANAAISEEVNEDDSTAFMAHADKSADDSDA